MLQPTRFGRYVLLERIGAGGMGEVFAAVPQKLWGYGKLVAVKRILPELSQSPEFLQRFWDEVRLALPLSHPNVVQVHEFGRVERELFVVMELVDGRDLRQIMRRLFRRARHVVLSIPAALYLVKELLAGLHYCHQHQDSEGRALGVVHRDVCPANVLVSFEGAVKLADFGLALSELKAAKTDPRHLMGHLGYIAPEQMGHGEVDHRADIYSAGVMLFELLTGQRFLPPGDLSGLYEAKHGPAPRPSSRRPEIPPRVDLLVEKAVAVDPEQRFSSALELLEAIQRVLVRLQPVFGPPALTEALIEPFFRPEARQRRLRALQSRDLATLLWGADSGRPGLDESAGPLKRVDTLSYPIRAGSWSRRGDGSSDEDTLRWGTRALIGEPLNAD